MAISYSLAPEPVWILINLTGTTAGGGYITTKRSLDKVQDKAVYMDPAGLAAWPNPTYFGLNGVQGPFYWAFDSGSPDDTYFIQAFDADGTLLWEVDDFSGSGSGGGGNVTTYIPLKNYIANSVFIDHSDPVTVAANKPYYLVAPSNHKGFTPSLLNPVSSTYGTVGPDIIFNKNNTGLASDQITYPLFDLSDPALNPDTTPVCCIEYQCTGSPAGETFKHFQFPVCQKVKNLSNQPMTFSVWAKVAVTTVTLTASVIQYFGSAPTADLPVRTVIDTLPLTTSWVHYVFHFTMPDVSGKSLGTANLQTDDDAIYIHLEFPLGANCDVLFTKPALYLGTISPDDDFETYDEINSVNSTPRTGDIKTSLSSSAPNGWVAMNDGSIGNVGSGATTRANADTFQLYKTIWDGVSNTYAPTQNSVGTPVSRGASAIADFVANNRLVLPRSLGRALAGAGSGSGLTARTLGQYDGQENYNVTLVTANVPQHTHLVRTNNGAGTVKGAAFTFSNGDFSITTDTGVGLTDPATPFSSPVVQPTSFFNVFIKL